MLNGAKLRDLYYQVMDEGVKPLPQADLLYLVGQTRSNQVSVLDRARDFAGPVGIIGYPETERFGYPGSDVWVPELMGRGVSQERIALIKGSFVEVAGQQIIHTLSEMRALVRYAKRHDLRKVVIVAPRFHLTRSFMAAVYAVEESFPELKVWPTLGTPLLWEDGASHSQGSLHGIRADFMVEETIRIYTYHAQGNLPDPEEVLAYLDRL